MVKVASLSFYGGVGEIGGNKILLKDGDVKVFLDFGMSLSLRRQYFSTPFLSPKNVKSLLELGILPKLKGVYEFDEAERDLDAVFLSHSHIDHSGYVSFLKRSIPVYCGETTAIVLKALDEIQVKRLESDMGGIEFKTFRTRDRVKIGSVEIEPIHVDHSTPGSYGFIIHTSSGAIAYTGDFRLHGTKAGMTEEFVERVKENDVVAFITEGTNMTNAEPTSEAEVRSKINNVIRDTPGIVLADFSKVDIDRLTSFYKAVEENDRFLAITMKQAYLLKKLASDPRLDIPGLTGESILVFKKTKKRYYGWEREVLDLGRVVDASEIGEMQKKVVLVCSFYDLEELTEIKPVSESCYILSASEPYSEETEIDYERLIHWLEFYGLPQYHIHVSGHIMPLQLRSLIERIRPKEVFSIHCECPELFGRFVKNLSHTPLIEEGKEYSI